MCGPNRAPSGTVDLCGMLREQLIGPTDGVLGTKVNAPINLQVENLFFLMK